MENSIRYCPYCRYAVPVKATRCAHCGEDLRGWRFRLPWKSLSLIVTLGSITVAIAVCWQTKMINKQTENMSLRTQIVVERHELDNRPYLYVDVVPALKVNNNSDLFIGAEIAYRNKGSHAADIIKSEVKIGSDLSDSDSDLKDIAEWIRNEEGSYPYIKSIFPGQEVPEQVHTPHIGNIDGDLPQYIYVGVRVLYEGFAEKIYSCGYDYVYKVGLQDKENKIFSISLLRQDQYWDENKNTQLPPITTPNWEQFK